MKFRPAREADLPRIVEIYNSASPGRRATADLVPVTVATRADWFRRHHPKRPLVVCEIGETIAAWFGFEDFYGRAAYSGTAELGIYVAPESQRRGLGRALLDEAISMAPGLEVRTLVAWVFAHNEASLRLLSGAGFGRWGHLPKVAVMDGVEYDVLILGRRLG
jgi:phosphinothricin acetyltransferase